MELNGIGKAAAALFVLIVALDLYGKWTGATGNVDLIGANRLGDTINANVAAAGYTYTPTAGPAGGFWTTIASGFGNLLPYQGIGARGPMTSGAPAPPTTPLPNQNGSQVLV